MNLEALILRKILLEQDEEPAKDQEPKKELTPFEEDPMGFILKKYHTLNELLTELMTDSFQEYLNAIFIVAPKPTTFKVLLHNGQYFFLTYLDKAYQATISGKNYYLMTVGEKQLCMQAIARLLRFGSPLKTKGPEGAEQGTEGAEEAGAEGGGEETAAPETPPAEGGEETLTEARILSEILKTPISEVEGEQKKSVLFETALVIAWYELKKKEVPEGAVSESEVEQIQRKYPELIDKAKKALKVTGLASGKSAYSAGKLTSELTPFWRSYGATNRTSKADVILGDARVSVKAGPSQLMSGVKEEAKATFYAALRKCPELVDTTEVKNILKQIENFAKSGRTKGNIRQALKIGKDAALLKANEANKKAMKSLENLFESNEKFATEFAKEAMSGAQKFGSKSLACAEYILSVDANYDNAKLHKTTSNAYAKKIAAQMKVDVRFKTGSIKSKGEKTGEYGYATVLGLQSDPTKLDEVKFESIKSFLSNLWQKLSSSITSVVHFFVGNPENVEVDVQGEESIDFS